MTQIIDMLYQTVIDIRVTHFEEEKNNKQHDTIVI